MDIKDVMLTFVNDYPLFTNLQKNYAKGEYNLLQCTQKEVEMGVVHLTKTHRSNLLIRGEFGSGCETIIYGIIAEFEKVCLSNIFKPSLIKVNFTLKELAVFAEGTILELNLRNLQIIINKMQELVDPADGTPEIVPPIMLMEDYISDILISSGRGIILFIPEINQFLDLTPEKENSIEFIKFCFLLENPKLRVIGTTDKTSYDNIIKENYQFRKYFTEMEIKSVEVSTVSKLLNQMKLIYEKRYNLNITYETINSIVNCADKYVNDGVFPFKAQILLDEVCSFSEKQRLLTYAKFVDIRNQLQRFKVLNEPKRLKKGELSFKQFKDVRKKLKNTLDQIELKLTEVKPNNQPRNLESDVIGKYLKYSKGISSGNIGSSDAERLSRLEEELKSNLLGQEEAVDAVIRAIRRSRAGLADSNRPIASFFFAGPTGVGKTQLAKVLARIFFDTDEALTRFDMSEFNSNYTISRLTGTTAGYIGYGEGGELTNAVRKRPASVILFDEIEKGHNAVFDILLQLLEDGRLSDSKGTAFFNNTIIIITSNVGASEILQANLDSNEERKKFLMDILVSEFRPEIINRFDEVIVFQKLTKLALSKIYDIMVKDLQKNYLKSTGARIEFTRNIKDLALKQGYSLDLGARPLRRAVTKYVTDNLAQMRSSLSKNLVLDCTPIQILEKRADPKKCKSDEPLDIELTNDDFQMHELPERVLKKKVQDKV